MSAAPAFARLWFVRHAPTHARALIGWSDVSADLSDRAALARTARALPEGAALVSSDLVRAAATGDALLGARTRLAHDPALRELHFGAWEGLSFDEVSARWPAQSRRYWSAPGEEAPPNGESWNGARARVSAAVDRLARAHRGQDLVIVAHFGAILTQYARAAGLSAQRALAQPIAPLSVTRMDFEPDGGSWRVHWLNRSL